MGYKARGYKEKPRLPRGASRVASPIVAPGGLGAVQALLNTVVVKTRTDELETPRDLSDWLTRQGMLPAGTELTEADLKRTRDVREGLRALAALNRGAGVDVAAVARLDQAALGARAQIRFDADGGSRLDPVCRDFDDALGTLLAYVHLARVEGKWPWFKLCDDPKCRRAYFDFTKSRTGLWCTRRCGERVRSREYRQRAQRL